MLLQQALGLPYVLLVQRPEVSSVFRAFLPTLASGPKEASSL